MRLQLLDVASGSGPPDGARIFHHVTDELRVDNDTFPDGEALLFRRETSTSSLWTAFFVT